MHGDLFYLDPLPEMGKHVQQMLATLRKLERESTEKVVLDRLLVAVGEMIDCSRPAFKSVLTPGAETLKQILVAEFGEALGGQPLDVEQAAKCALTIYDLYGLKPTERWVQHQMLQFALRESITVDGHTQLARSSLLDASSLGYGYKPSDRLVVELGKAVICNIGRSEAHDLEWDRTDPDETLELLEPFVQPVAELCGLTPSAPVIRQAFAFFSIGLAKESGWAKIQDVRERLTTQRRLPGGMESNRRMGLMTKKKNRGETGNYYRPTCRLLITLLEAHAKLKESGA